MFRYWSLEEKSTKAFVVICLKCFGYALIGIAMASVVFVPLLMAFMKNSRLSSTYLVEAFYTEKYYRTLLGTAITSDSPGAWSHIGLSSVCIFGSMGILQNHKKDNWLKGLLILSVLFLSFPIVAYIFNGFGYASNRWSFFCAFLGAFCFAKYFEELWEASIKVKVKVSILCVVYSVISMLLQDKISKNLLVSSTLVLVAAIFVIGVGLIQYRIRQEKYLFVKRVAHSFFGMLLVLGILVNAYYLYSPKEENYVSEFADRGSSYEKVMVNNAIWEMMDSEEFYRIDWNSIDYMAEATGSGGKNAPIYLGQSTTSEYWSIISPYLNEYMKLNSSYSAQRHSMRGMQSRSLLLPFASAKYFLGVGSGKEKRSAEVPYGYQYVGEEENVEGNIISLYESDYVLPFAYSYDAYITRAEYEDLEIEERQQVMFYGAVLEENIEQENGQLRKTEAEYFHKELPYEMKYDKKIDRDENVFTVHGAKKKVTISMECPPNHELYVKLEGVKYEGKADETKLIAKCGGQKSTITHFTDYHKSAHGRTDYLLNLYTSDKERKTVTLTFSESGVYTIEKISVIAQPMDILEEKIESLRQEKMKEWIFSVNQINGDISLEEERLVCFSLPYSEGWRVFIDGEETELLQTNIMYSGVLVPKGEHEIELRYFTPYLKEGIVLSLIGFCVFIGFAVYGKNKKERMGRR